jgi:diacylglycerol kinase (ATP)
VAGGRVDPGKRTKALFVLNPAAKGCRGVDHCRIADALASAGLDVETVATGTPDVPAREAGPRGFERVVVAGGDGSLRSVLCATDLPVALLPMGTSNSVARSLGIPLNVARAVEIAAGGEERPLDLGEASGPHLPGGRQPFMLCASAGIDAEIARRYELVRGGMWQGFSRYAAVAAATTLRHVHVPFDIDCDGRPAARGAKLAIAANMRIYGGWFVMSPDALPDDGLLDLTVVRAEGSFGIASTLVRAGFAARQRPSRALTLQCRKTRWESKSGPVLFEIDGEPVGRLPVDITIRPGAARMVLPRSEPSGQP